ncbi:hypothetical protein DFJ43DRAFT_1157628 [Lentinula guzmanii]|uniref:Uncharacterized protein n=1 Tax=Lentinula guzmanii TaxID=2804957 RepID=A0AA38JB90_9AGAR|nr:hypothetical protein DFJ43DRAFT_1157628 [Lentinula guzmanii]
MRTASTLFLMPFFLAIVGPVASAAIPEPSSLFRRFTEYHVEAYYAWTCTMPLAQLVFPGRQVEAKGAHCAKVIEEVPKDCTLYLQGEHDTGINKGPLEKGREFSVDFISMEVFCSWHKGTRTLSDGTA